MKSTENSKVINRLRKFVRKFNRPNNHNDFRIRTIRKEDHARVLGKYCLFLGRQWQTGFNTAIELEEVIKNNGEQFGLN